VGGTTHWAGGEVFTEKRGWAHTLYGFTKLKDVLEGEGQRPRHRGCGEPSKWFDHSSSCQWVGMLSSDGMLSLLGLDDGLGGVWLDTGVYTGDRPINFAMREVLRVHLQKINTTENIADGGHQHF